jgi:hypothetical protein
MSQYPVSQTAPTSSFDCACPWHTPDPERGRNVGEPYREGTGRYPEAWCVECCMELPYRLTARDLARLTPADQRHVANWLWLAGWPQVSAALRRAAARSDRGQVRNILSSEIANARKRSRAQTVAFLATAISRWKRFILQDVMRKANKNPARM